jgi:ABC-type transport system substrate-binding protein/class 3 adenylate cyclase
MAVSAGERRIVSVLLADIVDSTAIGERLGPERSKFLFDEVTRLLAAEVKRFGGTVAQLTGDGLYALFGVPHAHEDDAERAVRAGLAMQAALDGYAKDIAEAYDVSLAVRVGVNTGAVVLLPDEAPPEERYNALGDTVNTAARLQAHAGAGRVAIGPGTAQQVEAAFELESIGALVLNANGAPVGVLGGARERERQARHVSPLVGRDAELAVLETVFGDLAEGRGAIVAVTGEPGIGKSRLVAEIRARWDEAVRCVGAQGISYAQDVPYYPVRELLRGILGLGVGDPEARVRLELKMRLGSAFAEDADAKYPFLASLLGLTLEPEAQDRIGALARDSVQRQTHEAVAELARALSREQPLALVLEDLHFADEPTLELFEELLSLADEEAVAVLLLYRNDPDLPSWRLGEAAHRRYRHRFRELQLEPLEPDDAARLAASAVGAELPPDLAARLAERTGGNPLFVEEAARDAVERGNGAEVPAAVRETLQARLDRLAPDVREVASVASVVGRSFGMPLLEQLVSPARLRPALSELQRLDLVVEERRRPTPEYRFRHGLVQEAAYTSLLQDRRRELHRIVGTALEELATDELAEAYGLLAHHFEQADEPERAARYLLQAGDAAKAVYADEEAIAHYRRALGFLDRLGDSGRARSVLFKIALSHHLAFDFEAADAAWAEAFARPEPSHVRLEPTERLETSFLGSDTWVPGHGYDIVAWSVGANFFRGLLRLERGLDVIPDLAEQVSVSPDGCVYTFRLRDGLRWSDGEPLTAYDFAFTYGAMQEQEVNSGHLLAGVDARARDERSLELRFAEPRAYILYLFAQLAFAPWPRHKVEELGERWHLQPALVGNGPFVIADVDEKRAEIAANPYWHGSRGNVRAVTIHSAAGSDALGDWRAGRLDYLLVPRVDGADETGDTEVVAMHALSVTYVGFPSHAPFDDERVRKALAHGLDRAPLMAESGDAPAVGGLIPPAMPGHSHDAALSYDVGRARTLLTEAGYPEGRGLPELRIVHPDPGFGDAAKREAEASWRGQWRELGVRLTQTWAPFEQVSAEASRDASLWVWGWVSDYPDPDGALGTLLEQPLLPKAQIADAMRLVDQARSLRSRDERLELYRRVDRKIVSEDAWFIPLVYEGWHVLHRPWVRGLRTYPLGIGPLDDVVVQR